MVAYIEDMASIVIEDTALMTSETYFRSKQRMTIHYGICIRFLFKKRPVIYTSTKSLQVSALSMGFYLSISLD